MKLATILVRFLIYTGCIIKSEPLKFKLADRLWAICIIDQILI